MRRYENECVECGLPCLGKDCPRRRVLHLYCDKCGEEKKLYHFEGEELCLSCIEDGLEKVE